MELFLSRGELLPRKTRWFFRLIRAGWFPTSLASMCFVGAILVGHTEYTLAFLPTLFLTAIGAILAFDAASRISDFQYYSTTNRMLNSLRLLMNLRKSFCSRQVAIALYGNTARLFYKNLGYRWYHIFPDGAFRADSVFFKPRFWKSVFGRKGAS